MEVLKVGKNDNLNVNIPIECRGVNKHLENGSDKERGVVEKFLCDR